VRDEPQSPHRDPKGLGFWSIMDTDDDVRRQQPTLFRRAMNSWMIVLALLTLTADQQCADVFWKDSFQQISFLPFHLHGSHTGRAARAACGYR